MNLKCLIIMIGNTASGKSTYVKDLIKKGYISICKDGIRYSIGGGKYIFNPKYEVAIHCAAIALLTNLLKIGANIVIDETNMDKKTRKVYLDYSKKAGYKNIAIVTPKVSLRITLRRRMKDKKHGNQKPEVWAQVFTRKKNKYERPTKKEGFDEIINLEKIKNDY
ncbi:hypothetical protein LCGC14_1070630 [marine sediment metagenome]|uniref:Zeta toxin domain-containing protein n=1 Tax=marine sediment metagenome TaxID=412755 RepID=A0A0F9MIE6_9ZZZZ